MPSSASGHQATSLGISASVSVPEVEWPGAERPFRAQPTAPAAPARLSSGLGMLEGRRLPWAEATSEGDRVAGGSTASGTSRLRPEALLEVAERVLAGLAGPSAQLRADQLTAAQALACDGRRVLCVQSTGWGKSAVYWIAAAALREAGSGPVLVVSPLLALMRDQVSAAERAGA